MPPRQANQVAQAEPIHLFLHARTQRPITDDEARDAGTPVLPGELMQRLEKEDGIFNRHQPPHHPDAERGGLAGRRQLREG